MPSAYRVKTLSDLKDASTRSVLGIIATLSPLLGLSAALVISTFKYRPSAAIVHRNCSCLPAQSSSASCCHRQSANGAEEFRCTFGSRGRYRSRRCFRSNVLFARSKQWIHYQFTCRSSRWSNIMRRILASSTPVFDRIHGARARNRHERARFRPAPEHTGIFGPFLPSASGFTQRDSHRQQGLRVQPAYPSACRSWRFSTRRSRGDRHQRHARDDGDTDYFL